MRDGPPRCDNDIGRNGRLHRTRTAAVNENRLSVSPSPFIASLQVRLCALSLHHSEMNPVSNKILRLHQKVTSKRKGEPLLFRFANDLPHHRLHPAMLFDPLPISRSHYPVQPPLFRSSDYYSRLPVLPPRTILTFDSLSLESTLNFDSYAHSR